MAQFVEIARQLQVDIKDLLEVDFAPKAITYNYHKAINNSDNGWIQKYRD